MSSNWRRVLASIRQRLLPAGRRSAAAPVNAAPGERAIGWIVYSDQAGSNASYRYTCYIPARELGGRILVFEAGMDAHAFLEKHRLRALVLGKAFGPAFVALAEAARARRIPVLAAMCDWHFDNPINRKLSRIANRTVVQTEMMAAGVRQHFKIEPAIIEEPYEGPRGAPRFAPAATIRLLWYGHSSNLDTLGAGLEQVGKLDGMDLQISIVTERPEEADRVLASLPESKARVRFATHAFSLDTQWRELAECDIVLLPSYPAREKLVKGHGRLVQAIHSGRLALAYPLPQYEELADFCWCGEDLGEGLAWALAYPAEVLDRIRAGQAYVDQRFSPARIASRWAEEIERA